MACWQCVPFHDGPLLGFYLALVANASWVKARVLKVRPPPLSKMRYHLFKCQRGLCDPGAGVRVWDVEWNSAVSCSRTRQQAGCWMDPLSLRGGCWGVRSGCPDCLRLVMWQRSFTHLFTRWTMYLFIWQFMKQYLRTCLLTHLERRRWGPRDSERPGCRCSPVTSGPVFTPSF